ncbi:MAG: ABC transporter substrate-binding protein, partial [Caldilineaceae bacterium]
MTLVGVLLIFTLAVAACGSPATAPTAADEGAAGEAPAAAPEATAAPAEEATPADEDASNQVVQESSASQGRVAAGETVTSDEDVTTPRDPALQGGEYRSVATSDFVNFHPPSPQAPRPAARRHGSTPAVCCVWMRTRSSTFPTWPRATRLGRQVDLHLQAASGHAMERQRADPTAQDFKWTFDRANNPDNGFPYRSQLDFITSYEALDDYTLEVKIDEVYAPALGQISGLITPLPKHVWENLDWSDPETNPEINNPTVTSGPYTLQEWKREQYAIYAASDSYWYKGRPNISQQIDEIVPDQDIAYQKLKSGESDTGTITPENLEEARNLDNVTVYEWWPAAASWSYIGLNMRDGYPTSDVHVRRGINYAIDKELLTDEVMLGQAKRLCSVFPETSWAYTPDVECYPYDPAKAIAEFEMAGYTYDEASNTMLTPA